MKTGKIENRVENRRESFLSRLTFFILPIWKENKERKVLRNAFYTKCTLFTTWWLLPLLSNIALAYVFFFFGNVASFLFLFSFFFFWFSRLPFFFFCAETLPIFFFFFFLRPGRAFFFLLLAVKLPSLSFFFFLFFFFSFDFLWTGREFFF